MQPKLRVRLGRYIREKRNFIKVGTLSFGVPAAVGELWIFGKHGDLGLWLLLLILTFAGAWVWASVMWLVIKDDLERISDVESKGPGSN
jgi:hypothetical protein